MRNMPESLVVGCTRTLYNPVYSNRYTRNLFNFFTAPVNREYHDLHSNDDFYHVDYNPNVNPDQAVDFFEFQTPKQFNFFFLENCSIFTLNLIRFGGFSAPQINIDRFVRKCDEVLKNDGILLIKGILPNDSEKEVFMRSGYTNIHNEIQEYYESKGNIGWAIYYKNRDPATFRISHLCPTAQELIQQSGYKIDHQTSQQAQVTASEDRKINMP